MKQVIKDLASDKEKSREKILTIKGNTHDGYDVFFKNGRIIHCRTKLDIRKCLA